MALSGDGPGPLTDSPFADVPLTRSPPTDFLLARSLIANVPLADGPWDRTVDSPLGLIAVGPLPAGGHRFLQMARYDQ